MTQSDTTPHSTLGVVIPTIGTRPEIDRLLRSVLAQTRPVDVIRVVVDADDTSYVEEIVNGLGGSVGDTEIEVRSTGAQRAEGAYLVETGYGVAVNTGLQDLDTDLVALLDDDDEILPSHFANLEAALDPSHGRGVAYTRVTVVSPDGSRRRPYQEGPLPEGRLSAYTLIGAHPVLLPATLIHRSVLDVVGGLDGALDRKADTDMLVRLGEASEFAGVGDATYLYYRNPHGSEVRDQALQEMAALLRKHAAAMSRRERWLSWDSLVRSALRAELPAVARDAAVEAISPVWPHPPEWSAALYVRLRRLRVPRSFRSIARRMFGRAR